MNLTKDDTDTLDDILSQHYDQFNVNSDGGKVEEKSGEEDLP